MQGMDNIYAWFVSLHDSDHDGVVSIFVALHYAAQFFSYQECHITWHNFSPTRSVTLRGTIFPLPEV